MCIAISKKSTFCEMMNVMCMRMCGCLMSFCAVPKRIC